MRQFLNMKLSAPTPPKWIKSLLLVTVALLNVLLADASITIYYDNSKNTSGKWDEVWIYAWGDDTQKTASWPGAKMTRLQEDGIWAYTFPGENTKFSLIFNNGNNGKQTNNFTSGITNGVLYKSSNTDGTGDVKNQGAYTGSTEIWTDTSQGTGSGTGSETSTPTFYVAYDGTGSWTFNHKMTAVEGEDGTFTYKYEWQNDEKDTYLCFFDGQTEGWTKPNGVSRYGSGSKDQEVESGTKFTLKKGNEDCFKIKKADKGTYTITLSYDPNDSKKQYVIFTKDDNGNSGEGGGEGGDDPNPNPNPNPQPTTKYYISYDDSGSWTFNKPMTAQEDGTYTYDIDWSETNRKIYVTFFDGQINSWDDYNGAKRYGLDSNADITPNESTSLTKDKSGCYIITSQNNGKYTITLSYDPNDSKKQYVIFTKEDNGNSGEGGGEGEGNEDPNPNPNPDNDSFTIYYDNSKTNWNKVCVYYTGEQKTDNWPGDEMTKLKQDGMWSYTFPHKDKNVNMIIFNAGTDGNDNQTVDYTSGITNGNYYLGEKQDNKKCKVTDKGEYKGDKTPAEIETPGPQPSDKPDADIIVFFENTNSWSQPYCYAWLDDPKAEASGKWPGDKMTKWKDNIWYWICPADKYPNKVIFNPGGDDGKTGDLVLDNKATYNGSGTKTVQGIGTPVAPKLPDPSDNAGAVSEWENSDGVVKVTCEKATLYITPYAPHLVKVFTVPNGVTTEERRSISVVAEPNVDFSVDDDDWYIYVNISDGTKVTVDKENGLLSFTDDATSNEATLTEEKYLDNVSHSVKFSGMEDAAYYGGGYNANQESIMGLTSVMNNSQKWGYGKDNTEPRNFNIPFVVSTNGYGLLFEDHYRGASITTNNDGIKYTSGAKNPISYFFVGGGNIDEVLANYTHLTGRQPLPPYWALGYLTSRYGYHSESEANGIINDIKNANIPLDGIVFDLYWEGQDESGMGNLDWYTPNFPNAQNMLKGWKDKGIHTTLITEPYFTSKNTTNWNYLINTKPEYLADKDQSGMGWLKSDKVGLLDATNPEALDWMYTFYKARTEEGVDGWWLDLGEPEQHDGDAHHMGGSVDQVHNEFGLLWHSHIYNNLKRDFPNMRQFMMPRSGTSGMQHYAAFPWTGDIEKSWGGLQAQIPSLINATMSGCSYIGSDAGGFATTQGLNANLYLRWIEFAALSPMLRTHSAVEPEPTNGTYSGVLNSVRNYINLRYRILPYTYTLSYENTAFGYPMARPACAFDEVKSRLASNGNTDSYLWGRDIYVAPVVKDANSRNIKFPEGDWLDLYDVMLGNSNPKTYSNETNYNAPLERLPFFLRKGGFLPTFGQKEFGNTADLKYNEITLYHYMDNTKVNTGIMYVDDRTSPDAIEKGEYSIVYFDSQTLPETGRFMIAIRPDQKFKDFVDGDVTYHIHLYGCEHNITDDLNIHEVDSESGYAPKASMRRAAAADETPEYGSTTTFTSLEAAQNHTGDASYYDSQSGHAYIKLVKPASSQVAVGAGNISTNIEGTLAEGSLHLTYCAGDLNYSVPAGYDSAVIEVYSAEGTLVYEYDVLTMDGVMHSVAAPTDGGFYIARIKATNNRVSKTETTKFIAK